MATGFYSSNKAIIDKLEPHEYKIDDDGVMVFSPNTYYEFPEVRHVISSDEKINNCVPRERINNCIPRERINVTYNRFFDISETEKNKLTSLATEYNIPIAEIKIWIVEYMMTSLDNFKSLSIMCRLPVN